MVLSIQNGIDTRLFAGMAHIHHGGRQVSLLNAAGDTLIAGEALLPPTITQAPAILPAGATIGSSISLHPGAASGTPAPAVTWDLTRDGISISDQVDSFMALELTLPGQYDLTVTWSNGVGDAVAAPPATLVVVAEAPPPVIDYAAVALAYFDADTPYEGTAEDVAAITMPGTGSLRLARTGTGSPVRHLADGLAFADGAYLQSQSLSGLPMTDGLFAVADVTLGAYGTNMGQIVDGQGHHVKLRNNAGALQATGQIGGSAQANLGPVAYGSRVVVAAMLDDAADLFRTIAPTGNESSAALAMTDPALIRLSCGRYLIGTLHRLAVVGRPEGGDWPVTMQEVYADFHQGA